jgi:class 3 adenylate cyclase
MDSKQTTVLCSDVIGYSKMMGMDEEGTLVKLDACRAIIDPLITEYRGRLFNTAGDSVLMEFADAVDAIRFGVEMQHRIGQLNNGMRWRIGVNLGQVFVYGTNLLGDTVNLAARIESQADYGGICMSSVVYEAVRSTIGELVIEDRGPQEFKNIDKPINIYAVKVPGSEVNPAVRTKKTVRYSREELIKGVVNDRAAQGRSFSEAQHYKLDRNYRATVRILMWRLTRKCADSMTELLDIAAKGLVPEELRDPCVAVITEYCKNIDSDNAMKISKLLEGPLGAHRAYSLYFLTLAAKTNVEALVRYFDIVIEDPASSLREISDAVDRLQEAASRKHLPAILRLAQHYALDGNKREQFKWLWIARSMRDETAQDELQKLANAITKNEFNNYKFDAEALLDEVNFKCSTSVY